MADWMEIIIEAATSISQVNRDWLRLQLAYSTVSENILTGKRMQFI